MKALHISHTDIESDSRILKEMGSLACAGYTVSGIGVTLDEGARRSTIGFKADIQAIQLKARGLTFLPRTLRHAITLLELAARVLPRAVRQRPDIVHCHDTLALPLGALVKLLTKARLVYDAHELESDRNGLTRLQGRLTLWVERMLWRWVDALIVVSPSIEKWYHSTMGPKTSAVIMNSPVYAEAAATHDNYLRRKFEIPPDRLVFVYVGILGPGRGIDLITQAFTHADVSAHVVFLGYGELAAELKLLEDLHGNVHVHDAVAHSQVVPIVKSADFGLCLVQNVSLSDYYCLPNKLFEYCFAGVPVLASDFPDIRTVLATYGIGECCELDPTALRRAVVKLTDSPASFTFKDVTPLSWQAQERKLIDLYQRVATNPIL